MQAFTVQKRVSSPSRHTFSCFAWLTAQLPCMQDPYQRVSRLHAGLILLAQRCSLLDSLSILNRREYIDVSLAGLREMTNLTALHLQGIGRSASRSKPRCMPCAPEPASVMLMCPC